jgi:hypothetical protein
MGKIFFVLNVIKLGRQEEISVVFDSFHVVNRNCGSVVIPLSSSVENVACLLKARILKSAESLY